MVTNLVRMVNDVPVFDDRLGFGGAVTIPINKWIRHGANQVSAQLLPLVSAARADQREFSAQVDGTGGWFEMLNAARL